MRKLYFTLVLILCAGSLHAEKMRVAVLDLKPEAVPTVISNAITSIVRTEMVNTGYFTVVERDRMDAILREQGFQSTGCTDSSCAVQVGRLLSAEKILIGEVSKVAGTIIMVVRIVDVEKGIAEFAANEKTRSIDDIDLAGKRLTEKLVRNIYDQHHDTFRAPVKRKTMAGYYWRGVVPGWGQLYADRDTRGYGYLGSFLIAGTLTAGAAIFHYNAKSKYNDVPRGSPQSDFDEKYDTYRNSGYALLTMGGLTAAIYLMNWVDVIFLTKPGFSSSGSRAAHERCMLCLDRTGYDPVNREYRAGISFTYSF